MKLELLSKIILQESVGAGDFVKDTAGKKYKVFGKKGSMLDVAPYRGDGKFGGNELIHPTKVTKIPEPECNKCLKEGADDSDVASNVCNVAKRMGLACNVDRQSLVTKSKFGLTSVHGSLDIDNEDVVLTLDFKPTSEFIEYLNNNKSRLRLPNIRVSSNGDQLNVNFGSSKMFDSVYANLVTHFLMDIESSIPE